MNTCENIKKAVVTGANGYIGSKLVNKLIENNVHVIAIDLSFTNLNFNDSSLVTRYELSIDDLDKIDSAAVKDADAFFHFAWRGANGVEKVNPFIQLHNIQMVLKCAEFSKRNGIKKILCAGTIAEQAINSLDFLSQTTAGMMYGAAKYSARLLLESYCKNIGLDFIWLQYSNIYGTNNKTGTILSYALTELLNNREATFGSAEQPYDFIYIDDIIEATYRLGFQKTQKSFYFVGSGKPRKLKEYLLYIGQALEKPDLIKIGVRNDDGILYSFDMFNNSDLINEIGEYVPEDFEKRIKYTIDNF